MEKKYARLAALLAAAVLCGNGAPSMAADWWEGNGTETIKITEDNAFRIARDVYGDQGHPDTTNPVTGHVEMTGGTVTGGDIYGGWAKEAAAVKNSTVKISGGTVGTENRSRSVYGGRSSSNSGEVSDNTVRITGGTVTGDVYGGRSKEGAATGNRVTITGGTAKSSVYGGCNNGDGEVSGNTVTITGGTVGDTFATAVYGGSSYGDATGNTVAITGGTVKGDVYGGWSGGDNTDVTGNTVVLSGSAVVSEASLHGRNAASKGSGNTLLIDGWSSSTQSVKNFDTIRFQGVTWVHKGTLLTITKGKGGDLGNTKIDAGHVVILGGRTPQVGESMTFVTSGNVDTGLSEKQAAGGFTQGVATAGTAEWDMPEAGKTLNYKITGVFRNAQTDAVAENRLAGAAFVNQGADIAADSLRLLDDGYHFGTQTFGAVYGNRSQYDVASDIKINGWSEIAGFGNIHEVKGGRLAWGVFYENGTGNYRTWNTFNNEMFRGDGSLLYNGGGAAVRLTKDSGVYYEASFRAGTLSSSMTNAVRDGYGNSYGFDSDSTYWGAHVGAGKLIQRGSGQWDIYGKYFHTDIDGDSFEMGGDRFSFDSVTSDRLRLGARYTADTDKAWSLYCGAAYEYEFSGGSHMKAGQFEAPEQSLQGSTVFGEIGTVWGRKDSPWSMDVNLRGYAGEREGFSGMVQLAYAF